MKRQIIIYDPKKQKDVITGIFDSYSHTFYKKVSSKHYMIKEQGYGFQDELVNILQNLECKLIQIKTKTTTYEFPFEILLNKPIKDYGHGLQRFIKVVNKEN